MASDELEAESGASLSTVLSHTTEVTIGSRNTFTLLKLRRHLTYRLLLLQHLLFGPSLRASQPYMDCLSDHLSGYASCARKATAFIWTRQLTFTCVCLVCISGRRSGWRGTVCTCWTNASRAWRPRSFRFGDPSRRRHHNDTMAGGTRLSPSYAIRLLDKCTLTD